MIARIALMLPHSRRAVMVVVGIGAVAACSIFAASGQSIVKNERAVQEQVTNLQARQAKLITERDQPQTTASEMTQSRQQPAFAQDEIARLAQERTQVLPRSPTVRPQLAAAPSASRQPQNRVSQTGSVARPPARPPQAPVRPTQTALKRPGPGLLVAEAGK